jgi:hypothetical protein
MTLRLFVWNCNTALHQKVKPILALQPDIAVISNCAYPEAVAGQAPEFEFTDAVWIGRGKKKGLGVFSFGEHLTVASTAYDPKYELFLPIILLGRHSLNLLAVWARPPLPRGCGRNNGRSPRAAMRYYRDFIAQYPALVAGDFYSAPNGGASRKTPGFLRWCDELTGNGWVSAWRPNPNEVDGATPVACRRKNARRVCGVDCCLIPRGWLPGLQSVTVCRDAVWTRLSHHRPLVVDLSPLSSSPTAS